MIEVSGVSKAFRLPHERRTTLKEHFLHPFHRTTYEVQQALDDVELHGRRGRVLRDHRAERQRQEHAAQDPRRDLPAGLRARCASTAGCRRSSSSASASTPSSPRATTSGSTARCSASRKRELEERFDEIVAFAGLERFVDQKLKNFSSGMQVRLAYSIAIQVDFDILLLDEVLAVGDAEFQEKCFATFDALPRARARRSCSSATTSSSVAKFCERAVWVQDGRIAAIGPAAEVLEGYAPGALEKAGLRLSQDINLVEDRDSVRIRCEEASWLVAEPLLLRRTTEAHVWPSNVAACRKDLGPDVTRDQAEKTGPIRRAQLSGPPVCSHSAFSPVREASTQRYPDPQTSSGGRDPWEAEPGA